MQTGYSRRSIASGQASWRSWLNAWCGVAPDRRTDRQGGQRPRPARAGRRASDGRQRCLSLSSRRRGVGAGGRGVRRHPPL